MKIGILTPTVIREMPYLDIYYKELSKYDVDVEVINWNRFGEKENFNGKLYSFNYNIKNNKNYAIKIIAFIKYQKYILQVLKNNKYDKIIILCPQTIYGIYRKILKLYKNNYLLDIRDYSIVNKDKRFINSIIKNSYVTAISSEGYLRWLPKYSNKYILSHNITDISIEYDNKIINRNNISVATIGSIRDYVGNSKVINELKNKKHIKIEFYGKGVDEEKLKEYSKNNNVENIYFYGAYQRENEYNIYKNIDIINAYTEEINNLGFITALPNRIYNAAKFLKPIIVRKDTFLGDMVREFNLGIVVDLRKDNLVKEINDYIINYNIEKHIKGSEEFLKKVLYDKKIFEEKFIKFLE